MKYVNNLGTLFENIVLKHKNNVALIFDTNNKLTYGELNILSNQISNFLLEKKITKNDTICISLDKTKEAYALIIACIKLGITYFAVDPKGPIKRFENIIKTCSPKLIFSDRSYDIENLESEVVLCLDENKDSLFYQNFSSNLKELNYIVTPKDNAYVMFTSGSTGSPKGVVINQANLMLFIDWSIKEYQLDSTLIHTHINPIYFDNSVFDIYRTFFSGATLVPFKTDLLQDPSGIVEKIEKFECNVFFSVPSMLVFLQTMKVIDKEKLKSLKKIIFGGEGYPLKKLKEIYDILKENTEFINVYGPTECTCICSSYLISDSDFENLEGYPPLGDVTGNFGYYILNENQAAKNNEVGELCLGGPCVGLGYFNNQELTNKVFIQNPLNSSYNEKIYRTGDLVKYDSLSEKIWFVGRKDFQIKHQGYRIELEEIEHAMMAIPEVNESIALHHASENKSRIIGIISTDSKIEKDYVKNTMLDHVPKYMIPAKIHFIEKMPKNANGKTDRKQLKEMFINQKG